MVWLAPHAGALNVLGLVLNLIGFAVVAVAQSGLFREVHFWLTTLDFTVETLVDEATNVYRFTRHDKRMEQKLAQNRRYSWLGWALVVMGVLLQIPSALLK